MMKKRSLAKKNTWHDSLIVIFPCPWKNSRLALRKRSGAFLKEEQLLRVNNAYTGRKNKTKNDSRRSRKQKNIKSAVELIDPLRCIQNLLGEERNIQIKTIENSDCTYIQYESDGDKGLEHFY